MVLSKHLYIGMLHPKMNSACYLLPIFACKVLSSQSIYSLHMWVKWRPVHPLPKAFRILMWESQEIWKSSIQKLSNKVLYKKIVNSYKFICTYHVIDDRKRGKRLNRLLVKQKGLAPDGSVFVSCLCCLLCNVSKCFILTKP